MPSFTTKNWKSFAYDASKKYTNEIDECPICLSKFRPSEGLKLGDCGHYLCPDKACQDMVLKKCHNCPLCRSPIKKELPVTYGWGVEFKPLSPNLPMPKPGEEPWNQPDHTPSWFKEKGECNRNNISWVDDFFAHSDGPFQGW